MKANICLLFPITDDDVVAWAISQNDGRPIVKELAAISRVIHDLRMECSFYYDSANFNDFVQKIETLDADKCYLAKITEQIKGILYRRLKDVHSWKQKDINVFYAEWKSATSSISVEVPLLYKYAINCFEKTDCVVVNFNIFEANQDNEIHILKDAHPTETNLPEICSLSIMESADDTIEWLYSIANEGFSLRNSHLFLPTAYRWGESGQRMYKRIDNKMSNTFWYFDFFHKDNKQHYEVYNEGGDHIGEADMKGELIPNSQDPHKSISHILHGH